MKRNLLILVMISCMFTACNNKAKSKKEVAKYTPNVVVKFEQIRNYFVRNDIKKTGNYILKNEDDFNGILGMATTMGIKGKPSVIDFEKKNVIAVILSETDFTTTVNPVRLEKNANGDLVLTYKKVIGEKQTFTVRPFFAIAIAKNITGNLIVKNIK